MINNYLTEMPLLINRLKEKTIGFKSIGPFEDIIIGGDIEADQLPACLVGDAKALLNQNAKSGRYAKSGAYFVMVITENGGGSHELADQLVTSCINSVLYTGKGGLYPQWIPDDYQYPFELARDQPAPIYDASRTVRTLIFTIQTII